MSQLFISHAVPDRPLANDLRQVLTARGFRVWSGPRTQPDGEPDPGVRNAIRQADHVLVLLTPHTAQDRRVREELLLASEARTANSLWQRLRGWVSGFVRSPSKGDRIVPLLYPGVMLSDLRNWFEGIQVGLPVRVEAGDLEASLPMLLSSLGEPLAPFIQGGAALPLEELTLRLINPARSTDGSLTAIGTLLYQPASGNSVVESHAFPFRAPTSPLPEAMDWYLASYPRWPVGRRRQRAQAQEVALQDWGQALYQATLAMEADRQRFAPWLDGHHGQRRFSVEVDSDLPLGSDPQSRQQAEQAATDLLAQPWELLHDGGQFLLQANPTVPIRRRIPNSDTQPRGEPPVRVLYLAPRPSDQPMVAYRDAVLAMLDSEIALTRLEPPTQAGLERLLDDPEQDFQVLHLDGQVVLDEHQQPALLLESSGATTPVTRYPVTTLLGRAQPALVVLQLHGESRAAHQATQQLLAAGVGAVLLLTDNARETARHFLAPFYRLLAQGTRIGEAVLAGRRAAAEASLRPRLPGGAPWPEDWFVPVLYQNRGDIRLLGAPSHAPTDPMLPPSPQTLVGRDREFLTLERLLRTQSLVVLTGAGGLGKSTLAMAMAQWLGRTAGFRQAQVDIREINAPEELLAAVASQLALTALPASPKALGLLLAARATVVVLDHVDAWPGEPVSQPGEVLRLCQGVLASAPNCRFLLTARQAPPDSPASLTLDTPALDDAISLLAQALALRELSPASHDPGDHLATVEALVAAAGGHPRVLSLIAPQVAQQGVNAVTEALLARRRQLAEQHPQVAQALPLALALERLPPERQEQLRGLAVFPQLVHRSVLARVLDIPETATAALETALVEVGLAHRGTELLYLDPDLPNFLRGQLSETELAPLEARWSSAMRDLAGQLLDTSLALGRSATRATLPPLLGLLDRLMAQGEDALMDTTQGLRRLLREPKTATPEPTTPEPHDSVDTPEPTTPEAARSEIPEATPEPSTPEAPTEPSPPPAETNAWDHQQFTSLRRRVEQLLDHGELASAQEQARQLLQRSLENEEHHSPQASLDLLSAYLTYARTLRVQGTPKAALEPLRTAHQRATREAATRPLLPALEAELGESHLALGDLDAAVGHYRQLIEQAQQQHDQDGSLLGQLRLGAIQLHWGEPKAAQQTLEAALAEAPEQHPRRGDIQQLLSTIHRSQGDFDNAEQLNQQALEHAIRRQDRSAEAAALAELSTLFDTMGRLEEAARLAHQATRIAQELDDPLLEGRAQHNLADTLMKLARLPEARVALEHALDLKLEQGAEGEIWKSWHLLSRLDTLQGQPTAEDARRQAIESFLAYRQGGGVNPHPAARLCQAAREIIRSGGTDLQPVLPPHAEATLNPTQGMGLLLERLRRITAGERDPTLAESPQLHYQYVAELRLLLNRLSHTPEGQTFSE